MPARLILAPGKDKALRAGYPWAFANQIARLDGEARTGDIVEVAAHDGTVFGRGFFHTGSLIAFRFLTRDLTRPIDTTFWHERLARAISLRESFFAGATHARLAYAEADGLPGTIVDRYGEVVTFTTLSAGMEQRRDAILDALESLVHPACVVERNENPLRAKDGLSQSSGVLRGEYPGPVEIEEGGARFRVDVLGGLKTGFFLDQREHRHAVGRFARGRAVLDVCCADGGFGLHAAVGGAASVRFLDASADALDRARENAELTGLDASTLAFERADALQRLGDMVDEGQRYGLVVLDPPAFAKSRQHADEAEKAYQRLNISGFRLLEPGGFLATASCSQAVSEADFLRIVRYSARRANVRLRLVYRGGQPPDHPILDAMPETHYLKFFVFQTLDDETP